jgi:Zn-dependent peptidase ImmA (M78 family)
MAINRNFLHATMDEFCRQKAKKLLEDLKIIDPPVDVESIAMRCGLEVHYLKKGKGFYGRLLKERRIIEVEQSTHPHRQRFTIAHEIGHFILGHNPIFCVFDDKSTRDPIKINEKQARVFASELLMPEKWIRDYWLESKRDHKEMARKFHVSEEAMFRRLEEIDLLGIEPAL